MSNQGSSGLTPIEIVGCGLLTIVIVVVPIFVLDSMNNPKGKVTTPKPVEMSDMADNHHFAPFVLDGCEYIMVDSYTPRQSVVHKGNCKFCLERKR